MKNLLIKLLLLLVFPFYLISKGYKFIQCQLVPIERKVDSEDSQSVPNNFSHPRIPSIRGTSINWAGFVAVTSKSNPATNSVSQVMGSWFVPKLTLTSKRRYCAIWIGIDGYKSGTVEQIGTEHDAKNGRQTNYAWFEMYPRNAFKINNFPVHIGDLIGASVVYKGNDVFTLTITNHTRNIFTVIPSSFTTMTGTLRNSAEWIVEAPFLNGTLPLADFSILKFRKCFATINGIKGTIRDSHWVRDRMVMITNNGTNKAVPFSLAPGGKAFKVVWKHE